jgi:hypothetical protein
MGKLVEVPNLDMGRGMMDGLRGRVRKLDEKEVEEEEEEIKGEWTEEDIPGGGTSEEKVKGEWKKEDIPGVREGDASASFMEVNKSGVKEDDVNSDGGTENNNPNINNR